MIVLLENVGLPVPEETALIVAGYLVWQLHLRSSIVLAVAVVSAVAGDTLGYGLGWWHGQTVVERVANWGAVDADRMGSMRRFVMRYGATRRIRRQLPPRAFRTFCASQRARRHRGLRLGAVCRGDAAGRARGAHPGPHRDRRLGWRVLGPAQPHEADGRRHLLDDSVSWDRRQPLEDAAVRSSVLALAAQRGRMATTKWARESIVKLIQ